MVSKMRKVLLTGGSRGIGLEIKTVFESNGYRVIAPTRQELDLNDPSSVKDYLQNSACDFDVLINNAGINEINTFEHLLNSDIDAMFQTNLLAPIQIIKALIPHMREQKYGRIVNIGSIWSVVSKPGRGIYSSTKRGLHGITSTLSLELASDNVLVNTVCPGFTLTELTYKNNTKDQLETISNTIPMKRLAEPREIAEIVYFLCSDKNTYLTGQEIVVDGGYSVQ